MSRITADRAGVSDDDDRYGWSNTFIPMLVRVTREWPPREGLTFGVYGPWGSGKSTILNLLEARLQQNGEKYPNTYMVRFNPWFYDSPQTLVTSFFASMGATLNTEKGKRWSEAGDLLKKMGKFLSFASKGISIAGIKVDAEVIGKAADAAAEAGELVSLADTGERSLRETREKLVQHLNELGEEGGRIMVLIDDVDRLDSQELFTLLRLLRTVADLPSITLLVAMDEHRVSEVLGSAGDRGYGRAYLEKIVQAHVHVPIPAEEIMEEQLRTGVVEVLQAAEAVIPESLAEPRRHSVDLRELRVLNRVVRTPRDLGRYLNGLRLLTLTRETWDLNPEDTIHLAALHVFYPDVYDRVRRSKSFLTDASITERLIAEAGDEIHNRDRRQRLFNRVMTGEENEVVEPHYQNAADLIREMFGDVVRRRQIDSPANILAERRISAPEVFDSFFAFDAAPTWIPREEIRARTERLVHAATARDKASFAELVTEVTANRHMSSAIFNADLLSMVSKLSPEELDSLGSALLDAVGEVHDELWSVVWGAFLPTLQSRISFAEDTGSTHQLARFLNRWIETAGDPATAKARLDDVLRGIAFPAELTKEYGRSWLRVWHRALAHEFGTGAGDDLRKFLLLVVEGSRWEKELGERNLTRAMFVRLLHHEPSLLEPVFSILSDLSDGQPEAMLVSLVGGGGLLSLTDRAEELGIPREGRARQALRKWREDALRKGADILRSSRPEDGVGP